MKKLFIILLLIVYGFSSSGMTISLHYCCGKLDGISFIGVQERSCKMGNHMEKSGCCNDQQIAAVVSSDQQASVAGIFLAKQIIETPVYQDILIAFYVGSITKSKLLIGIPISISSIPLFIKNRMFRI